MGSHVFRKKWRAGVIGSILGVLLFAPSADPQGVVILARKVPGEIALDPDHGDWLGFPALEIPLAPQVMAKPRIYESKNKSLKVRALHNSREIAFRVEWEDPTENSSLEIDQFPDAAALEFPSSGAKEKPHFAMGDPENSVNLWYWKASRQKPAAPGNRYATVDEFLGGVLAGNPVSQPGTTPVENLVARGFGSSADIRNAGSQHVAGRGKWSANRWAVILKRELAPRDPFEAAFREGKVTPVAFALWNGAEGERGGRKVVSTWYYAGLQTEEKKTLYLYPVVAFIGIGGLEAGLIVWLRRKSRSGKSA